MFEDNKFDNGMKYIDFTCLLDSDNKMEFNSSMRGFMKKIILISTLILSFTIGTIAKDKEIKLDPCKKKEINFLHFIVKNNQMDDILINDSCYYIVKLGKGMKYLATIDSNNTITNGVINYNDLGFGGKWKDGVVVKKFLGRKKFSIKNFKNRKITVERKIINIFGIFQVLEYSRNIYDSRNKIIGRVVIGYKEK